MIPKSNVSYKTIQANKKLGEFVSKKKNNEEEEEEE